MRHSEAKRVRRCLLGAPGGPARDKIHVATAARARTCARAGCLGGFQRRQRSRAHHRCRSDPALVLSLCSAFCVTLFRAFDDAQTNRSRDSALHRTTGQARGQGGHKGSACRRRLAGKAVAVAYTSMPLSICCLFVLSACATGQTVRRPYCRAPSPLHATCTDTNNEFQDALRARDMRDYSPADVQNEWQPSARRLPAAACSRSRRQRRSRRVVLGL